MSRIKRLIRPEPQSLRQALNWKAAIPVLGLLIGAASLAHAAPTRPAKGDTAAIANFDTCERPEYPAESIKMKHTGTVTLTFLVAKNGKVKDSKVKTSSGHRALDDAARVALTRCSFKPATAKGKPVEDWTAVQYVWTLE